MKLKTIKLVALAILMALPGTIFAHDEGHGPKLADVGNYGGVVTAVVAAQDAKLGVKAPLLYKAELARSEDGTVRVYLYDKDMKPLDMTQFDKSASAKLIAVKSGQEVVLPFDLQLEGTSFTGKAPEAPSRPFNIDVTAKSKGQELLSAFDNLD